MRIFAPYGYFAPEHAASSYIWINLHEDFAKTDSTATSITTRGFATELRKEYATNKKYEV